MLAAAAIVSCEKVDDKGTAKLEKLTFKADILGTKTTLFDGTKTKWLGTDEITVFNGTAAATFTNNLGSTPSFSADFTGTLPFAATYWGMYPVPASNIYGFTSEEWAATRSWTSTGPAYTVPASQTAATDDIAEGLDVLVAETTGTTMSFDHACAALKFTVGPTSPAITSIMVEGAKIAGNYRYVMSSGAQESFSGSSGAITLSMGGTTFPAGNYYIMIAVRNYPSGLTFTFTNSDGKKAAVDKTDSFTPVKGHVYPMGTIGGLSFQTVLTSKPAVGDVPTGEGGIVAYVDESTKKAYLLSLDETSSNGTWSAADTWITGKGSDWSMPTRPLYTSMRTAILAAMTLDDFNGLITAASGTALQKTTGYWTSTKNSDGSKAYYYRFNKSGSDTNEYYELGNLTGSRPARAVKVLNYND